MVPEYVQLIDTGDAVARRLKSELAKQDLLSEARQPLDRFYGSGDAGTTERTLAALWPAAQSVTALGF